MSATEITKIFNGKAYRPREVVRDILAELIRDVGGEKAFEEILDQYDSTPNRALEIAFRHSRLENILGGTGETLVALSVHAGLVGILRAQTSSSAYPWIQVFLPAAIALGIHVALQAYWTTTWCTNNLWPAFAGRSKNDAVRAGIVFYTTLVQKLVVPGRLFYPAAAITTLLWIDLPFWAWCVEIPAAIITGWMAMSLYYMRLLHTDIRQWLSVFAIELSEIDEKAIRDARKGRGLHRALWDWLERRGCENVSHFEISTLVQCAFGMVAGIIVLAELVLLADSDARFGVTVPIGLGILVVGYSYLRRYAFLNRARKFDVPRPDNQTNRSGGREEYDLLQFSERDLDDKSRVLRRAMP